MVREDYVMRIVYQIARFLAKLVMHKDIEKEETLISDEVTKKHMKELIDMADHGEINEAEDKLYDYYIEDKSQSNLALGIEFYLHLSTMEEDFLEAHDYSKEEIRDGLLNLADEYGQGELMHMFVRDAEDSQ